MKGNKTAFYAIALITLVMSLVGCTAPTSNSPAETPEKVSKTSFTDKNYSELVSDPNAYTGSEVVIVGKVFGGVDKSGTTTAFQMWADPKNSDWNTVVFTNESVSLKDGDYVKVTGLVDGAYEGSNSFGGDVSAVKITADSLEKVDATAIGGDPEKTYPAQAAQNQHGLIVSIDKIDVVQEETRVYVTVNNTTKEKASFYSFNAKIVQNGAQLDPSSDLLDYPEVQSDILPGVKSSGVITFKRIDDTKPFDVILEATTENYDLTFNPYMFKIK